MTKNKMSQKPDLHKDYAEETVNLSTLCLESRL